MFTIALPLLLYVSAKLADRHYAKAKGKDGQPLQWQFQPLFWALFAMYHVGVDYTWAWTNWKALGGPIDELLNLYESEHSLTGMSPSTVLVLPLFSGTLGLLGAWLAVSRHLGDVEPQF